MNEMLFYNEVIKVICTKPIITTKQKLKGKKHADIKLHLRIGGLGY